MNRSKNSRYGYVVVLSGFIAVLGSLGFARFGYSMILPGMKDGLGLAYTQMGLMESGNFSGYMFFAVLGGMLASRYGPRVVIASSLGLTGASMLLTGFVESYPQALMLRSLTGVGSAGSNVPAAMLPAAWFSARRRGLAAGLITSGNGAGLIATGFLVPKLNVVFGVEGWRYSWLILGMTTICFAAFCGLAVRNPPEKKTRSNEPTRTLEWNLIRTPLIWKMGLVYLMFGLSYVIYVTFFGAYLVNEVSLSPLRVGSLWALVGFLSLASGPLWGHVSDKAGRGYGLAMVYFIHSLSFFLFSRGGIMVALNASAILFGLTAWSVPSIMAAYSGDRFGSKAAFSVFGFLTLFFGVGQALGPSAAGYIADRAQTFTSAFLLSSTAAALGGLLSLKMLRKS